MASPYTEVEVGERTVRVSHPDRVYFSTRGETKLDLVNYYMSVGDGIVRALRERPCMLHRYPDGVDGEKIYQKRLPKGAPEWVQTAEVQLPVRPVSARAVRDRARQRGVGGADVDGRVPPVALAPGRHRASRRAADRPRPAARSRPGRGQAGRRRSSTRCWTSWVRSAGRRRRDRAASTFTCASSRRFGFREVRRAALAFAREVERRAPDLVTTAWWKEERTRAIFVDYNQNARDRTIASALFGAGQAVGAGVGAGDLGRAARRRD